MHSKIKSWVEKASLKYSQNIYEILTNNTNILSNNDKIFINTLNTTIEIFDIYKSMTFIYPNWGNHELESDHNSVPEEIAGFMMTHIIDDKYHIIVNDSIPFASSLVYNVVPFSIAPILYFILTSSLRRQFCLLSQLFFLYKVVDDAKNKSNIISPIAIHNVIIEILAQKLV